MRRLSIPILLILVLALLAVGPATANPPESWTEEGEWKEEYECEQGHTLSVEGHSKGTFKLWDDTLTVRSTGGIEFRREDTGDFDYEPWSVTLRYDLAEDTVCITGTFFHMTLPQEGIVHQDAGRICYSPISAFYDLGEPFFSAGSHEFWLGRPDTYGIDYRTFCEAWAD